MIERSILPAMRSVKVADVSHDDVDRLHRKISKTTPIRANRVEFGIVTFHDSKLPFVEDEAAKITHPAAREAFLAAVAEAERPQELGIVDGDDDDPVP